MPWYHKGGTSVESSIVCSHGGRLLVVKGAEEGGVGSLSQELCACPPPPPPPGLGRGGCANCATYSAADRRAC
ncbi:hypothetical protein GW17_00025786 [Ensete ventricosum]|nr:hypothetical protein GW17_00025786 [Ensete ventricosum]